MDFREIKENKKQYLSLLLLADEQEDMIDRYINKGTMYVLDDDGVKCECVVTDEGGGVLEIKNSSLLKVAIRAAPRIRAARKITAALPESFPKD